MFRNFCDFHLISIIFLWYCYESLDESRQKKSVICPSAKSAEFYKIIPYFCHLSIDPFPHQRQSILLPMLLLAQSYSHVWSLLHLPLTLQCVVNSVGSSVLRPVLTLEIWVYLGSTKWHKSWISEFSVALQYSGV